VQIKKAAAWPGSASPGQVSSIPISQSWQTRRRASGRSSERLPQRVQKQVGTPDDQTTEDGPPDGPGAQCSGSLARGAR
jgi:hypothetical protein